MTEESLKQKFFSECMPDVDHITCNDGECESEVYPRKIWNWFATNILHKQYGLRWVKASERLPNDEKTKAIKFNSEYAGAWYDIEEKKWRFSDMGNCEVNPSLYDSIFWLEETKGELKPESIEAIEFATVDSIAGIMYANSTDEADEGKWIDGKDYHKVAQIIFNQLFKQTKGEATPTDKGGVQERGKQNKELRDGFGYEWWEG